MISFNLKKLHYRQAAAVAVALSAFFSFVVPLQTYLANRELFDYSIGSVALESAPCFIAMAIMLNFFLLISELLLGRFLFVLACAVLVGEYLEIGILSIGLPPFNAAVRVFQNPFRSVIDSAILAGVMLLCLVAYKWLKEYVHWIALAVLILSVSSLFDVRRAEAERQGPLTSGRCPNLDVLMSTRFSSSRNVMIFVLDSTPASITTRLLSSDHSLKERFTGFICFENNRAMHEITARGVPGLLTGKYLDPDISACDYEMSVFGTNSFLYPYAVRNDSVYFINGMSSDGFTNRRLGNFSNEGAGLVKTGPVFFRNSNETPYVSLFDTVCFRLVPYYFKARILSEAVSRAMSKRIWKNYTDETFVFESLKSSQPSETNTTIAVFHTSGTHGPISRDRFGNRLAQPTHDAPAFSEYAVYLFNQIASFMDWLRANGLYNNSLVVLCADHGSIELRNGDGTKGHGADDSILWVKPIGSNSPFRISSVPTSNCRISELVAKSVDRDLSADEIVSLLATKDRKFRAKFGSAWWSAGRSPYFYEWKYDDAGNVVSCENLGVFKSN